LAGGKIEKIKKKFFQPHKSKAPTTPSLPIHKCRAHRHLSTAAAPLSLRTGRKRKGKEKKKRKRKKGKEKIKGC